jgi:hypothetical protein
MGLSLKTTGCSAPQLRHEPITYSCCLPQLGQLRTFEFVVVISSSALRYGIKQSVWLDKERAYHFCSREFSVSRRRYVRWLLLSSSCVSQLFTIINDCDIL